MTQSELIQITGMIRVLSLRKDEIEFLGGSSRCEACGHLEALHNRHCCTFCQVPGCRCQWGYWEAFANSKSPPSPDGDYLSEPFLDAPLCRLFAEVVD